MANKLLSDVMKMQRPKMKEIWDNKEDEAWEDADVEDIEKEVIKSLREDITAIRDKARNISKKEEDEKIIQLSNQLKTLAEEFDKFISFYELKLFQLGDDKNDR